MTWSREPLLAHAFRRLPSAMERLPEDVLLHLFGFLDGNALSEASVVSHEWLALSVVSATTRFKVAFGADADPTLSTGALFRALDLAHTRDEAADADLMLWCAAKGYWKPMAGLVAAWGPAILHCRQEGTGATPLLLAVRHGHREATRTLLDLKADPLLACQNGMNALHVASRLGDLRLLQLLTRTDRRRRVETPTPEGRTWCVHAGDPESVEQGGEEGPMNDRPSDRDPFRSRCAVSTSRWVGGSKRWRTFSFAAAQTPTPARSCTEMREGRQPSISRATGARPPWWTSCCAPAPTWTVGFGTNARR